MAVWIRVTYSDGNHMTTRFNGTQEEAELYYLGQWFNIGNIEDNMQQCTELEVIS